MLDDCSVSSLCMPFHCRCRSLILICQELLFLIPLVGNQDHLQSISLGKVLFVDSMFSIIKHKVVGFGCYS
jgi:hypothetical protein